jgi:hypothetical protein
VNQVPGIAEGRILAELDADNAEFDIGHNLERVAQGPKPPGLLHRPDRDDECDCLRHRLQVELQLYS